MVICSDRGKDFAKPCFLGRVDHVVPAGSKMVLKGKNGQQHVDGLHGHVFVRNYKRIKKVRYHDIAGCFLLRNCYPDLVLNSAPDQDNNYVRAYSFPVLVIFFFTYPLLIAEATGWWTNDEVLICPVVHEMLSDTLQVVEVTYRGNSKNSNAELWKNWHMMVQVVAPGRDLGLGFACHDTHTHTHTHTL